jgi:MFS family permease
MTTSLLFWALFAWRTHVFDEPLIPTRILGLPIVRNATLSSTFALGSFVALSVVMPIYFEASTGLNAKDSGLALIPMMIATVFGAFVSGRLMSRLSHYKIVPLIGLGLGALASAYAAVRLETLSFFWLNALLATTTFGVGSLLPIATVAVQNAVDRRDLGTATASTQFFRQLGAAALVALFGAMAIGGGRGALLETTPGSVLVVEAMAASYRQIFLALAASTGLSFLFLIRMEELPLRGRRPD